MSFSTQDEDSVSDINVTPFVDVLLVLLIIFMITAPIINSMVKVDLPKDSYNKDGSTVDKTMRVIVDKSGTIYVNNDKIGASLTGPSKEKFQKAVLDWVKAKPDRTSIDLEADENVRYGAIVPVIARLKEMNVGMNLVISPEKSQ
jgi:biopolymer transport protein TolR